MFSDVAVAWRTLRKKPGFVSIAAVTLMLGIGANTAMFSIIDAVLLRPLPGYRTDRLFLIQDTIRGGGIGLIDPDVFEQIRKQAKSFDQISASQFCAYALTGSGDPEQLMGPCTSSNWFELLQAPPMLGRTFIAGEDKKGSSHVVVLDHGFWQRRFGANPDIIGKTITLNRQPWTIIGVMPPGFAPFGSGPIYTPHVIGEDDDPALWVFGRLKPGVSEKTAAAEIRTIADRLTRANVTKYRDLKLRIRPLLDVVTGEQRPLLLTLFGAAGFVLLIAYVNVANLFLVRAAERRGEMEIRMALGASRIRIARFVFAEALLISAAASAGAAALAYAGLRALKPIFAALPRSEEIGIDHRVLLANLFFGLVAAMLFGILPGLGSARPASAARMQSRTTRRWHSALIATEVALSFVLLTGAALMIQSFANTRRADLGYQPANVLTALIAVPPALQTERAAGVQAYARLRERISHVFGVRDVATATSMPMGGVSISMDVQPEGMPERRREHQAMLDIVSDDYFKVAKIGTRSGRGFTSSDRSGSLPVAIVSESIEKRYFAGHAIGKRLMVPAFTFTMAGGEQLTPHEIVGVVSDVRVASVADSGAEHIYLPESQNGIRLTYLVIRTDGDAKSLTQAVRHAAYLESPDTPLDEMRSLEERASYLAEPSRQAMSLLSIFAALAVLLAAIGIYGVSAYIAARRQREIGVRLALGAGRHHIAALIYGGSLRAALAGLAGGAIAAAALTRLLKSLLYGVDQMDILALAGAALFLFTITAIATTGPALRSARTDPAVILRDE
jgi:predicted permease